MNIILIFYNLWNLRGGEELNNNNDIGFYKQIYYIT